MDIRDALKKCKNDKDLYHFLYKIRTNSINSESAIVSSLTFNFFGCVDIGIFKNIFLGKIFTKRRESIVNIIKRANRAQVITRK